MSRWAVPQHFKVLIGGNTYIDCPTIVDYKGQSLFELRRSDADGFLGINFDLHREDGSKVATIRNGQFVGAIPSGYQIEGSVDRYTLLETATGRLVCDIRLRTKAREDAELDVSAQMYMPDGKLIVFSPTETNLGGIVMRGNTLQGCGTAIRIN